MGEPYLGEIRLCSFSFAPSGWALCNGQLLPISSYQALFSLLGTTYGGNGQTNFALPDLRGRAPMHWSSLHPLGERSGAESHTLSAAELPQHTHPVSADGAGAPTEFLPVGHLWAAQSANGYSTAVTNPVAMSSQSVGTVGGGQAHENRPPYLAINFVIALQGIFPSQT